MRRRVTLPGGCAAGAVGAATAPQRALIQPGPGLVSVAVAPHPLRSDYRQLELPAGLTIVEMLELAAPELPLREDLYVEADGVPVPRERWRYIRPKAGHIVTARPRLHGGGGDKVTRTLIVLAGGHGALIAYDTLTMGPSAGLSTALGGFETDLIGSLGLIPDVKPPNSTGGSGIQDSPSLFLEGARNQANLWGKVPDILGQHRMVPPYGANPYTNVVGDAQYLHLLFCWGSGEVEVTDLKIGEDPLEQYQEVDVETNSGTVADPPLTLYANDVSQTEFSLSLKQTDDWQRRISDTEADELSSDLAWSRGLVRFDDQGQRQSRRVQMEVRYRAVGDVTWLAPVFNATSARDSWVTVEANSTIIAVNGKRTKAVLHGFQWPAPVRGQYEVEWRRNTADTNSDLIFDDVTWTVLRRIKHADPTPFPVPLAETALRIRATDQLNRVVDEFSGVLTRVALDWDIDTQTWIKRGTRSPAAAFRHVLQGPSNRSPKSDDEIDLERLQYWSEFCEANSYFCDLVVDFSGSVREVLRYVCAAGRASLTNINGKWSVVIDEPQALPVQHLTPRNTFNLRWNKLFPVKSHGYRVRFNDADDNWRSGEQRVYAPGHTELTATEFENVDLVGVTSRDQIIDLVSRRLVSADLRPEKWECDIDFEHLVAGRGSLVLLTHDALLVGLASGRVKATQVDGSDNITGMTVDEALPMEMGSSYGVSVRTVTDAAVTAQVVTDPGEQRTVNFVTPLAPGAIAGGDLFGFGLFGAETIRGQVQDVNRSRDLSARLSITPYSDALFDLALPPEYDPVLTPVFVTPAPVIISAYTQEGALALEPDATLIRTVIEAQPLGRTDAILEAQQRPSDTGEPWGVAEVVSRPSTNIIIIGGLQKGEYWDLRFRWVVGALLPGPWTEYNGLIVQGRSVAHAALENLTISTFGGQAMLRWDQPTALEVRFAGQIRFRHSPILEGVADWSNSVSIGRMLPARNLVGILPLKAGTYLARIYDVYGEPGGIAQVSTKQASIHTFQSVVSFNETPSWQGSFSGTVNIDGVLQLDRDLFIDDEADFDDIPDLDGLGEIITSGIYDFANVVDLGEVKKVRVTTRIEVASFNVLDLIDDRTGLIDSWEDFDGGADQAVCDAQVWMRITDEAPGAAASSWDDGGGFADDASWADITEQDPIWKSYHRVESTEVEARGLDFQLRLSSEDPAFSILVSDLGIEIEEVA